MRAALVALLGAGALAGIAAPALAAPSPAGACRLTLRAEPDGRSFAGIGGASARVALLARDTGTSFAAAASRLCASGIVRPANLAPFSRLLVRNAEGAAQPAVYDDAEESPGALILEYAFGAGRAPGQAALEAALRCWRDPARAGCAAEDVGP